MYAHDARTPGEELARHHREFEFPFPALQDRHFDLSGQVGAKVTPEVAVYDEARVLVYSGRIDDRFVDFGQVRPAPTRRDLVEALDAVLAGEPVARARVEAVGCPLPGGRR